MRTAPQRPPALGMNSELNSSRKAFVNEAAARVADRDVRAGAFMRPLGASRAYDHLAHVALGESASLR